MLEIILPTSLMFIVIAADLCSVCDSLSGFLHNAIVCTKSLRKSRKTGNLDDYDHPVLLVTICAIKVLQKTSKSRSICGINSQILMIYIQFSKMKFALRL